MKYVVTD